jgi:hypothetical protein
MGLIAVVLDPRALLSEHKCLAIGAVHFVAHAGNLVLVHGFFFQVVPAFVPALANRLVNPTSLRSAPYNSLGLNTGRRR